MYLNKRLNGWVEHTNPGTMAPTIALEPPPTAPAISRQAHLCYGRCGASGCFAVKDIVSGDTQFGHRCCRGPLQASGGIGAEAPSPAPFPSPEPAAPVSAPCECGYATSASAPTVVFAAAVATADAHQELRAEVRQAAEQMAIAQRRLTEALQRADNAGGM